MHKNSLFLPREALGQRLYLLGWLVNTLVFPLKSWGEGGLGVSA